MTENAPDLAGFLPGLEPDRPHGNVRAAYEKSIARMVADGTLDDTHAGLCANLLRQAELIDSERKAYAVNGATREAVEIMKMLHEIASAKGDDEFARLVQELEAADA